MNQVAAKNPCMADKQTRPATLAKQIGKREEFSDPKQEAYLNLVRTHGQLAGQFAKLFKEYGISEPQYNALRILQGEQQPMQIYQIAERMVSPQSDISRLIERLDKSGWVQRTRCREDRRVVWIQLTSAGRSQLRKLARPVKQLHRQQFSQLTNAELISLNKLLAKSRT